MYTTHFGLAEKPFSVTPDPRFFFSTATSREAYATLLYGVRERKGFVVLTGEAGTGKTTLLHRLMSEPDGQIETVHLYTTTLAFEDLLASICDELRLVAERPTTLHRIRALNEHLIARLAQGGTTALLLDEAQNLRDEVLESLRLLGNLETDREKLLQIVLVGQPELDEKLERPGLMQLRQRVAVRFRLGRLTATEVAGLVQYRLGVAGGGRLFSPEALALVARHSSGIPRLVNNLCDAALVIAYGEGRRGVSADHVHEAALDLGVPTAAPAAAPPAPDVPFRSGTGWRRIRRRPRHPGRRAAVAAGTAAGLGLVLASTLLPAAREAIGGLAARTARAAESAVSGAIALTVGTAARDGARTPAAPDSAPAAPTADASALPADTAATLPEGAARADVVPVARPAPEPGPVELPPRPEASTTLAGARQVRIARGSTLSALGLELYPEDPLLGLTLMKDANPWLHDVDRIPAGEVLTAPPMSAAGLRRRGADGAWTLPVASFATMDDAERLARRVRQAGFAAEVRPVAIAPRRRLYRVEVRRLADDEAAARAWRAARDPRSNP